MADDPFFHQMRVGAHQLTNTPRNYLYGPVRAIVEAPDNLKDWGATVVDISVLDDANVTVAGNSSVHLSVDDLVDALSLGLSEAAKIDRKIGLAGHGIHIFSLVPGHTGMMASLSREGELNVALVSRPDHAEKQMKNAGIYSCVWQRKGSPPSDEWSKPAHYQARNPAAVAAMIKLTTYQSEMDMLWAILERLRVVHKKAMEHDTGAVYSGVLYEVSGLVDSLDLTTDPTDIRLSEDCTQHVFNGRTLHQPFPKHGRSLREWVRYVLVTEAQATRAHSPLALNSCALPPPAQLKIHFLSRGQIRLIMLRPGNLDRGEPTNEVEHVKVTDRMTNKRPRMKLPDGFGHVTFGVLPNSRGVFTYTNSGILVSANEEALLPAEFRDTSLVMGLCAVIEYGPSAPLPTADKCNILDGHPLVVKKFVEKKFKEWAAAIIKPGGAVVDHRPQTRIKIHQAKGTYAAVTTLVAAHGFKLSGCDRCGKWRRLSDVLSKRRGGFVCADINDENFNACEKEEEDWVTLRNELEAKEEEQQEAAAAAAGGNGGTGAGGLHWIEKEVISASVVPDQQAKLTQAGMKPSEYIISRKQQVNANEAVLRTAYYYSLTGVGGVEFRSLSSFIAFFLAQKGVQHPNLILPRLKSSHFSKLVRTQVTGKTPGGQGGRRGREAEEFFADSEVDSGDEGAYSGSLSGGGGGGEALGSPAAKGKGKQGQPKQPSANTKGTGPRRVGGGGGDNAPAPDVGEEDDNDGNGGGGGRRILRSTRGGAAPQQADSPAAAAASGRGGKRKRKGASAQEEEEEEGIAEDGDEDEDDGEEEGAEDTDDEVGGSGPRGSKKKGQKSKAQGKKAPQQNKRKKLAAAAAQDGDGVDKMRRAQEYLEAHLECLLKVAPARCHDALRAESSKFVEKVLREGEEDEGEDEAE